MHTHYVQTYTLSLTDMHTHILFSLPLSLSHTHTISLSLTHATEADPAGSLDDQVHSQAILDAVLLQVVWVLQNLPGKDQTQLLHRWPKASRHFLFQLKTHSKQHNQCARLYSQNTFKTSSPVCQTLLPKHVQNNITSVPDFTAKTHSNHHHQCAKTHSDNCQQCAKLYCQNTFKIKLSSPVCQTSPPKDIYTINTSVPKHRQNTAKLYCLNIFNTSSPACQTQLPVYMQNIATRMPNITANAKVKYIQAVITSVPNCAATSSFKWKHIQTYKYIKHCHQQCAKLSRHFFFQVRTHSKHQNTFDIMHSNYGIISSKQFSNKIYLKKEKKDWYFVWIKDMYVF